MEKFFTYHDSFLEIILRLATENNIILISNGRIEASLYVESESIDSESKTSLFCKMN